MTITQTARTSHQPVRPRLRVGLVNNMPDGAVTATERQFRDLLQVAALNYELELVLFQIPEVRRHPDVRAHMEARYQPADAIAEAGLSALVVTGAEAGEGPLRDQAYWPGFARLVDRAVAMKLPTLWSCLAAHVVVDHLDGIKRRALTAKYSGYYPCAPTKADPLLEGIDQIWSMPHSRYNDIAEAELEACGYEILTRSPAVGADVFVRRGPPLFLFCQGHPEYDRHSLTLEYKRDIRAYLQGERASPPALPAGALDPEMKQTLTRLTQAAVERRSSNLALDGSSSARLEAYPPEWRTFAVGLYRNWLHAAI
jgi:homoserine O-succinyltransferase